MISQGPWDLGEQKRAGRLAAVQRICGTVGRGWCNLMISELAGRGGAGRVQCASNSLAFFGSCMRSGFCFITRASMGPGILWMLAPALWEQKELGSLGEPGRTTGWHWMKQRNSSSWQRSKTSECELTHTNPGRMHLQERFENHQISSWLVTFGQPQIGICHGCLPSTSARIKPHATAVADLQHPWRSSG